MKCRICDKTIRWWHWWHVRYNKPRQQSPHCWETGWCYAHLGPMRHVAPVCITILLLLICCLALTGCGGLQRTITTVPDRVNGSLPPPASQPATSEDWTALTIKLDEARAEVNRKAAELEAKARNERTWMFTMIGSGILLLLGGGVIAVVGFKTPTQHTTKVGVFVAIVGLGFILIAPHGSAIAKPVLFGAYALFGTLALGAMFWMANNLYYDWLDRRESSAGQ